jgi:hypothetical protein
MRSALSHKRNPRNCCIRADRTFSEQDEPPGSTSAHLNAEGTGMMLTLAARSPPHRLVPLGHRLEVLESRRPRCDDYGFGGW